MLNPTFTINLESIKNNNYILASPLSPQCIAMAVIKDNDLKLKKPDKFNANVLHICEPVRYKKTWVAKSNTRVNVLEVGYAGGYLRSIEENTPVVINQKKYPIVGRVSKNLHSVDIGFVTNVSIGDKVILWGDILLISKLSNRIPYELLIGVSSRVVRKYL